MLKHAIYLTSRHQEVWRTLEPEIGNPSDDEHGLNSYFVRSNPDLVVMEGGRIGKHTDGIDAWQPLLILRNYENRWHFKGPRQHSNMLLPQSPGTLVILDIGKLHCVNAGERRIKTMPRWRVLAWNPGRCPPMKSDYSLEEVVNRSREVFMGLLAQEDVA